MNIAHLPGKLVPHIPQCPDGVHYVRQVTLHGVEYHLDRAVHRVVGCAEDALMARGVNYLLDQNVSVRVQIIHRETVPIARSTWANRDQNQEDKAQK